MKIRVEYIVFWVLIVLIIFIAIWKLIGFPTDTAALISIALFFAGSEILLWKTLFSIDKRASVGFIKLKNEIDKQNIEINYKLDKIEDILITSKVK